MTRKKSVVFSTDVFFFSSIFDLQLVKPVNVKHMNLEG